MTASEHDHQFPATDVVGGIVICTVDECVEVGIRTADGWRSPTPKEQTDITIAMWEDTIMVQAFQIIHGKERGLALYLWRTGRGPNPYEPVSA